MFTGRKFIAIGILIAVAVLLTAALNSFAGIIYDYGRNLYLAGIGSLIVGLLFHIVVVRRVLPVNRTATQLVGVALSGVVSIFLYDLLRDVVAHMTFDQRRGSTINWGDDGIYSGLPSLGTGFDFGRIIADLPSTILAASIYGIVWFPLLVILERWTYRPSRPHSLKKAFGSHDNETNEEAEQGVAPQSATRSEFDFPA